MHHGVIFSFGSAKVCSPAIFETCFSFDKDTWIASTDYYMYFYVIVLFSIDIYSPVNKFYSVIIFSLLINVVILLLDCLVLILHFYPSALKGCRRIVFTHGVGMGGREIVCPGCISETVRCRKFILGRDIGWGV